MMRTLCGAVLVFGVCAAAYSIFVVQIFWLFAGAIFVVLLFGGIVFIQNLED